MGRFIAFPVRLEYLVSRETVLYAAERAELLYLEFLGFDGHGFFGVQALLADKAMRILSEIQLLQLGLCQNVLRLPHNLIRVQVTCIEVLRATGPHKLIGSLDVGLLLLPLGKPIELFLEI